MQAAVPEKPLVQQKLHAVRKSQKAYGEVARQASAYYSQMQSTIESKSRANIFW